MVFIACLLFDSLIADGCDLASMLDGCVGSVG